MRGHSDRRLLVGETPSSRTWAVLREASFKEQTIMYPRYFQEDAAGKLSQITPASISQKAGPRDQVLQASSIAPFHCFEQYADLHGFSKRQAENRRHCAYELLCSTVQYVFLLKGQSSTKVYPDDLNAPSAVVNQEEQDLFKEAIQAIERYSKF